LPAHLVCAGTWTDSAHGIHGWIAGSEDHSEVTAMIDPWVTQELRQIEKRMNTDDPRFAAGLRYGSPCPPREYRRRRGFLVLAAGTAMALMCALVAALAVMVPFAVIPALIGAMAGAAIAFSIAGLRGRRKVRRQWHGRAARRPNDH
jgi:Protein of unknown function (DUF3040)